MADNKPPLTLDADEALDNEALPSVVEKDGVNLGRYGPLAFLVVVGLGGSWMMISGMQGETERPAYVAPGASEFSTGMRGGDAGVYVPPFGLGRDEPDEPEPEAIQAAPQQSAPPPRTDPLRGFAERQRLELENRRALAALEREAEREAFERERQREERRLTVERERRNEEIMRQRRRAPAVVFDESENEEW